MSAPGDDPPHGRLHPPPAVLREGAPAAVLAALPGSRAVGGAVRDALAGRPVQDVDVGAPLPPPEVAARLRAVGLKVFETGLAHGTLTAVKDGQPVEVTSLRRDVATDGRHAEVAWTTDWREDAARRDFTINAMSAAADGALWDYFGGRADLAAGVVRFVGDPATRLREDYLRALRFFRFQARYGRGAPDAAAVAAIRAAVPGLARLSAERVWTEIKRLLAAPDPSGALALMAETGVLGAVLPEAAPSRITGLRRVVTGGIPRDPVLRLAVLLGPRASPDHLASRLRFSSEEAERLAVLAAAAAGVPTPEAMQRGFHSRSWRAHLREASRLVAPVEPLWVAEAHRGGDGWAAVRERMSAEPAPEFPVLGRDALALGLPPGPEIGRLLADLRTVWIADDCAASRDALLARLRDLATARGLL